MNITSITQFAIFGSFVWAAILVGILLICLFTSEVQEQGSIAFVAVCAFLLINRFWGNVPVLSIVTWTNVLTYLGTGLVFAVIRIIFHGREIALDGSKEVTNDDKYELKGNAFRWWFIWPVALLTWVFSHLLGDVWTFIYERFSGSFEYFMELGFKSVKKK